MATSTSTTSAPSADEQAAVAAVPGRIVAAWAAHDAEAFGEVFTADGTMILPGVFLQGNEAIRDYMADAFTNVYQGTQVTGQPISARFLGPEVGLLITQGGVLGPGQNKVSDDQAIRATWLLIKQDGQWRLAAYQNTPRDAA